MPIAYCKYCGAKYYAPDKDQKTCGDPVCTAKRRAETGIKPGPKKPEPKK